MDMACHAAGLLSVCTACRSRCMYAFTCLHSHSCFLAKQVLSYSQVHTALSSPLSVRSDHSVLLAFASCGNTAFPKSSHDFAPDHKLGVMGVHDSSKQLLMLLSYVCWGSYDALNPLFSLFSMLMTGGTTKTKCCLDAQLQLRCLFLCRSTFSHLSQLLVQARA